MKQILNYYQVNELLATSGQPTRERFKEIAEAGYQIIINLALPSSTNAIADEGSIVTSLGMVYLQIPVVWEQPQLEDVKLFLAIMGSLKGCKIWVHCAKNMRVSCFIYFWQKYILQLPETDAMYPMNQIWQPEGVWRNLMQAVELEFNAN